MKAILFALLPLVAFASVSMRVNQTVPYSCDFTLNVGGAGTNVVNALGVSTVEIIDDDYVPVVGSNQVDMSAASIIDLTKAQTVFIHSADFSPVWIKTDSASQNVLLARPEDMQTNVVKITFGQVLRIDRVSPGNYLYSIISPVTQSVNTVTLPTNALNNVVQ